MLDHAGMRTTGHGVTESTRQPRLAVVCGVTVDHVFALGSLIAAFRRHNARFSGDFIVFHDGIPVGDQARLRGLWPRILFRLFTRDMLNARLAAACDAPHYAAALNRHSPMIFAKFEMLDLLAEYDKCLWLDVDVLIRGDLSALWDFDCLAWRPLAEGAFARRAEVMEQFADMCRDTTTTLPNGGVIGMAKPLAGLITPADLYAVAAKLITQTKAVSLDELALYLLAAARSVPLRNLDLRFNHPVIAAGADQAVIIHAIGPDKFWNATPLLLAYPDWARDQQDWVAVGGRPYGGPLRLAEAQDAAPHQALRAARNRAYWREVYGALRPELPLILRVDLETRGRELLFHLAGQADTITLRLIRQANERRIGICVHVAAEAMPPALQTALATTGLPPPERLRNGWRALMICPLAKAGPAIASIAAAIGQATSRVSN